MRYVKWVAVLAASAAVAGCGSDTTNEAAPAPTASATTATAPAGPTAAEDVSASLFTLADFPAGWIQEPSQDDDDDGVCDVGLFDEATADAQVGFSNQGGVPQVTQRVGVFEPGGAAAAMDAGDAKLAACTSDTVDDVEFTVSPTSFPAVGDETFSYPITAEAEGLTLRGFAIGIRSGDSIIGLTYADLGQVDVEAAEGYARRALAKLR